MALLKGTSIIKAHVLTRQKMLLVSVALAALVLMLSIVPSMGYAEGESTSDSNEIATLADSPMTQIIYDGAALTPSNGRFTFGNTGVACTVKVGNSTYNGDSPSIPAAIGENMILTFSGIPSGSSVTAEVATATGSTQKTIKSNDDDKTFKFAMSANSGQISVSVDSSATFVLGSQYDATYKSTYATIQYSIDNGTTWSDLSSATEKKLDGAYGYVLPAGTAYIKIIQPYNTATGKYTTNNGVGWMGEFTTPVGSIVQPYPAEFNGVAGYYDEKNVYGAGTYYINFMNPFWSLFWDSKTGGQVKDADVLTNGSCLIQDIDTNPAISHYKDPITAQKSSWQDADGSRGFITIIDNTANITCTLTPDRGYQVLSTNIKDSMGSAIIITPDKNSKCTFTFNIANNANTAIAAAFTKVADSATSTSNTVSGVALSGVENAIDSGNLDLTVSDAATDTAATATVGSGTAVATYDVTLDQYWNQGSADARWTNNLTELDTAATVTMQLDDTLQLADGETYQVVRDHNGTKTVVDSTYDAAANTLSFSSNEYSAFTLVKTASTTSTTTTAKTTAPSKSPNTSDAVSWPLIALVAVGSLAIGGYAARRSRNARH